MSRDSFEPASCNAAMADAAVTPEVVPPCEKSRLPLVSLSSSIFSVRTSTQIGDSGGISSGIMFSAGLPEPE